MCVCIYIVLEDRYPSDSLLPIEYGRSKIM